jgi:hypothetical protein
VAMPCSAFTHERARVSSGAGSRAGNVLETTGGEVCQTSD